MKKIPTRDKKGKIYIPKKQFNRMTKEKIFPLKDLKEIYHPIESIKEIDSQ